MQQTEDDIYQADNASAKEAKCQYTNERNQAHEAKVEQIGKIPEGRWTEDRGRYQCPADVFSVTDGNKTTHVRGKQAD